MRIQRINVQETGNVAPEQIDIGQLQQIVDKYQNKKGSLIPILQATQEIFGYLPEEAFNFIAKETSLVKSDMYGVATFYAQFRLSPVGKNIIKICHGTACHVQNANTVTEAVADELEIIDGETTSDGLFTLESVACLGCCSLAPVMMIGDETFGKLSDKGAIKIIRNIRNQQKL